MYVSAIFFTVKSAKNVHLACVDNWEYSWGLVVNWSIVSLNACDEFWTVKPAPVDNSSLIPPTFDAMTGLL